MISFSRLLLACALLHGGCSRDQRYSTEALPTSRFGNVSIAVPREHVSGFAVAFLPGGAIDATVRTLLNQGIATAVIDSDQYVRELDRNPVDQDCHLLSGEVARISQVIQNHARLPSLFTPLLLGSGSGSVIAYAALMQSPKDFSAGLLPEFCPAVVTHLPLCSNEKLSTEPGLRERLSSPAEVPKPILWSSGVPACQDGLSFFGRVATGKAAHSDDFIGSLPDFLSQHSLRKERSQADDRLGDLPLVEVFPAEHRKANAFTIFLSGDGGWASIDKDLADVIVGAGIPVIGFDALRYFWRRKTPEQTSTDLARVIQAYSASFGTARVHLVGFSLGADVLSFAYNRLPGDLQRQVASVTLLSPGLEVDFEVNLTDWLDIETESHALPELPEALRIPPDKLLCVYGSDEASLTICRQLPQGYRVHELPGSHHFDGDYDAVGALLLKAVQ